MRSVIFFFVSSCLLVACGSSENHPGPVNNNQSSSLENSSSSSSVSVSSGSSLSSFSQSSSSSSLSSSSSSSLTSLNIQSVDYADLLITPQTEEGLKLIEEASLVNHIANGIRLDLKYEGFTATVPGGMDFSPRPPFTPTPNSDIPPGSSADLFSETNVHVAGVDEGDVAKYDGSHWYVSREKDYSDFTVAGIQIVKTDKNIPSAEVVGSIPLFDEVWGSASELYLVSAEGATSHVAAIRNIWGDVPPRFPSSPAVDSDYWALSGTENSRVRVDVFDVTTPNKPEEGWDFQLDGSLIKSKKIGNTLYLLTRFDPWVEGLELENGYDSVRPNNEALLLGAKREKFLPAYKFSGTQKSILPMQCWVQNGLDDLNGIRSLIHFTAIDLETKTLLSSKCLSGGIETLYMSSEAAYLTGSVFEDAKATTVIHKFPLTEAGLEYAATGFVPGILSDGDDPEFRLDEYKGDLRVVTTQWEEVVSWRANGEHKLFVLEQNEQALDIVASIPNDNRPAPIGKPFELIYSVRFDGERAYVVTFLQTDPFYTIDLSNRLDPKIIGEVEMPGFASYMHPINEKYIFTLGKDANEWGQIQGMKVELIDVSQAEPKIIDTIILGSRSTTSAALFDLRAISFLHKSDDQLRIAMGINRYDQGDGSSFWDSNWQYSGLQLFEVNGLTGDLASLADVGVIQSDAENSGFDYDNRSVLHDDAIFFSYDRKFWAASWDEPEQALGPIVLESEACTEEPRFGLNVLLTLDAADSGDACDALVIAYDYEHQETLSSGTSESDGSCIFYGVVNRPGKYSLRAHLPGFSPEVISNVNVWHDGCHVIPSNLTINLNTAL